MTCLVESNANQQQSNCCHLTVVTWKPHDAEVNAGHCRCGRASCTYAHSGLILEHSLTMMDKCSSSQDRRVLMHVTSECVALGTISQQLRHQALLSNVIVLQIALPMCHLVLILGLEALRGAPKVLQEPQEISWWRICAFVVVHTKQSLQGICVLLRHPSSCIQLRKTSGHVCLSNMLAAHSHSPSFVQEQCQRHQHVQGRAGQSPGPRADPLQVLQHGGALLHLSSCQKLPPAVVQPQAASYMSHFTLPLRCRGHCIHCSSYTHVCSCCFVSPRLFISEGSKASVCQSTCPRQTCRQHNKLPNGFSVCCASIIGCHGSNALLHDGMCRLGAACAMAAGSSMSSIIAGTRGPGTVDLLRCHKLC